RGLDPRVQGGAQRSAAVLALRVRWGPHRDGAAWGARHPYEGPAAGLGQSEPQIHQQREGERPAPHPVPRRVGALTCRVLKNAATAKVQLPTHQAPAFLEVGSWALGIDGITL